jgi:hypothetical protein
VNQHRVPSLQAGMGKECLSGCQGGQWHRSRLHVIEGPWLRSQFTRGGQDIFSPRSIAFKRNHGVHGIANRRIRDTDAHGCHRAGEVMARDGEATWHARRRLIGLLSGQFIGVDRRSRDSHHHLPRKQPRLRSRFVAEEMGIASTMHMNGFHGRPSSCDGHPAPP